MKFEEIKKGVKKVFTLKEDTLYKEYENKTKKLNNCSDIATLRNKIGKLPYVSALEKLVNEYLENEGIEELVIDRSKITLYFIDVLDALNIKLPTTKNDKRNQEKLNNDYTKSREKISSQYQEILIAIDLCATEEQVREEVLKPYGLLDKSTNKLVL